MKSLFYKIIFGLGLIILTTSLLFTQEIQVKKYSTPKNLPDIRVNEGIIDFNNSDIKSKVPGKQSMEYEIIDTLANMYSYLYVMSNRAFVYDRTTENYMTIKRGALPQTAEGKNKTYNLFLRLSEDGGATWQGPIMVYDRDALGYFEARYPTIYGFSMNGIQNAATCFPVIDYNLATGTGDWKGYVSVLWTPDILDPTEMPMNASIDLIEGGYEYRWSNDSRILAGVKPDDPNSYYFVAASEVSPVDENNMMGISSIGLRYTNDVEDDIISTIPPAWTGDKFSAVTTFGSRFNQLVDFRQANDGAMYLGVYGNFYNDDPGATNPNKVGVSRSTDYGITWEDFNKLPDEKITEYLERQGHPGGSLVMGMFRVFDPAVTFYSSKAFVAFDNNEYSFITSAFLYNIESTLEEIQVIEIYYAGGDWGIRRVGAIENSLFTYRDMLYQDDPMKRLSGSDWELQLSSTKDGSVLLAKWMSFTEIDGTVTNDIFVATRNKNGWQWGEMQNITNDLDVDRLVLIPDYIPNDLSDIPVLKLESMGAQDSSTIKQYLKVGRFNAVLSVDEERYVNSKLSLEILPNPVRDFASLKVFYDGKPVNAEISVFDVLGNKVSGMDLGVMGYGTNYYDLKTNGWSSGVYYCSITVGDRKVTKLLNVLK